MGKKKKIYRAGVIPFWRCPETDKIFMLCMLPSDTDYGGECYQVSKGKVEEGEGDKQAAIREAEEELGLKRSNVEGPFHHIGNFLGRTEMFVCKIKDPTNFDDPHFETSSMKWFTVDQYMEQGRKLHRSIVRTAYNKACEIENITTGS